MALARSYFSKDIASFLKADPLSIHGELSKACPASIQLQQNCAWTEEIRILQRELQGITSGHVFFEYTIPRLGKRIDVALVIQSNLYVLEFKVGESSFQPRDRDQVWDYALDLKYFHTTSEELNIFPILIATQANKNFRITTEESHYADKVFEPLQIDESHLGLLLQSLIRSYPSTLQIDPLKWESGEYSPTPTIIQAASSLYLNHTVRDITRSDANGSSLQRTTDYILDIIEWSRKNHEKSICFVTGVPGAGKTLVGLNIAIEQFKKSERHEGLKDNLAVYLSGNGPLVKVLTEALARDKQKQEQTKLGVKYPITTARREVSTFIQIIHHYRDDMLSKIVTPIQGTTLSIDNTKHAKTSFAAPVEHVAIFDEAQRSWGQSHLASWLSRKKHITHFPVSEAEFLIWSLDLKADWAVIVCLVGGGQEINTGEAGIGEWLRAVNASFPKWHVYISDNLVDKNYAEGKVDTILQGNPLVTKNAALHLAVSMRSFRTEQLSNFVQALLDREPEVARNIYSRLIEKYPIVLTRDLDKAKRWLRLRARGSERYGMIVSSQAQRLRPLAIDVRCKPEIVHWFLDDINDVRSSVFLEDACTEFDVQGLELDWTCLIWDGDLRHSDSGWLHHEFKSGKWTNIQNQERRAYQLNAYRVLLTRARQGMVICVPEPNPQDETRNSRVYDSTYHYLKNCIKLTEI